MTQLNLEQLREKIDEIDSKITDLFKERMEIALDVAQYKKDHDLPILNEKREAEVLQKVSQQIGEPLDGYARLLFNTLFDVSKAYQNDYLERK